MERFEMTQDVEVSVICTVYMHEDFLRKCLDGFIMQKTNFRYEVLVHDDASTDRSQEIVIEYARKYPDIIIPILQEENQYSKGVRITYDILLPKARGKYIAFCEGDDYWCDETKLQRQYDYMEEHGGCSMCSHNTKFHDLTGKIGDHLLNAWNELHIMKENEVFNGMMIHTSSFFMRKEYIKKEDYTKKYWFGDFVLLTQAFTKGSVAVLPQLMSVYNFGVKTGVSQQVRKNCGFAIKIFDQIKYLREYDSHTGQKYHEAVEEAITAWMFEYLLQNAEDMLGLQKEKDEIVKAFQAVENHPCFSGFMAEKKGIRRFTAWLKYKGYRCYPIWKILMKIRYSFKG